jgi:hypothetical protein
MNDTPINKQAALFLSRKRHSETIQDALDGAANHLMSGKLARQFSDIMEAGFVPEPILTYSVKLRRDVKTNDQYCYSSKTSVSHHIGESTQLFGLSDPG